MDAQAPVTPGIEVKQHLLSRIKLRSSEHYAAARPELPAFLFEHDFALDNRSLKDFLHSESYVSEETILFGVELAAKRKDLASYDRSGADY
jgi:hypothetical protein